MGYECFDVTIEDRVAHVRFNRPDARNTLIKSFFEELGEIVETIDAEAQARAIVFSSTGKTFCAGLDQSLLGGGFQGPAIEEPARRRGDFMLTVARLQDRFTMLERLRMPVLAAVQGGCVGAGMELVAACDVRYASADAFFALLEVNYGFPADLGGLQRLPRLMSDGLVRELAYTARRLVATEALASGFVNRVWDTHEELVDGVLAIAREIAAKSPVGVWGTKRMLVHGRDHTIADGLGEVLNWQVAMTGGLDSAEGVAAYREKRPGNYEDLPPRPLRG